MSLRLTIYYFIYSHCITFIQRMSEKLRQIPDEIWQFLLKALPVGMAALAISVSVQIKNKTATFTNIILSIVIGVASCYLSYQFIFESFGKTAAPIILG